LSAQTASTTIARPQVTIITPRMAGVMDAHVTPCGIQSNTVVRAFSAEADQNPQNSGREQIYAFSPAPSVDTPDKART
jgi:hypothetical protein